MARSISEGTHRDFEIVKKCLLWPLLQPVDLAEVRGYTRALKADGSWADVDYKDMSTVQWKPIRHLYRLLIMGVDRWMRPMRMW